MTRLLPLLLAALLLAGCTFNVKESNIVFGGSVPVPDLAQVRQANPGYRVEEERIRTSDGEDLFSLRFIRGDAVATVLYFGGNGYTIARQAGRTSGAYRGLPVNLVLVDHRGYGGSTGSASLPALMSDAVEVHDAVRADPTLGGLPLVVHGHSLGSFMAGAVADQRTLDGLVLESTVTTAEAWTAHLRSQQRWWIRALVWRVRPGETLRGLGNAGPVSRLDEPVLFVVGEDDDVTPPKFSRELHEAVPVPPDRRQLLVASGRGHADATDTPEFRTAVAVLLERSTAANEVAEEAASPVAVAELDEFALGLARAGTFSGVVLVAKDGQVLLERAYGKRDARGEDENTIDTRFNLASAGKMFTAVAILQQVAAGRITLDTSVGEVLKDYPNKDFATQVTIRQLLTHTAGAGDIDLFGTENAKNRNGVHSVAEMMALHARRPPAFLPGSNQEYGNFGHVVLGRIVEVLSGQSFEAYLQDHVFRPSGMGRTAFVDCSGTTPDIAVGYVELDGEQSLNCETLPRRGFPAGGQVSTARDMFKFVEALRAGRLVPIALFNEAIQPQREFMGLGFFATGYGPGYPERDFRWGHAGSADGICTDVRTYPLTGETIIALSNTDSPWCFEVTNFLHHQWELRHEATRGHPQDSAVIEIKKPT